MLASFRVIRRHAGPDSWRPGFSGRLRAWAAPLLLIAALAAMLPPANAQTASAHTPPTAEQLRQRLESLEAAQGLDQTLRTRLVETYRLALERLEAAERHAAAAREYQEEIQTAPQAIRRLQTELQRLSAPSPVEQRYGQADLHALRQALTQEKASLTALQSRLADLDEQLRAQQARPSLAQEELSEAKTARTRLENELQIAPASEDDRLREAQRAAQLAQRHALAQRVRMLEQELLSHDARLAALQAERDLLARRVEIQAAEVRGLEELANRRSLAEAAAVAESAERAAEPPQAPPVVHQAAAANAALSQELEQLVQRLQTTSEQQQRVERELATLGTRLRATQRQLDIAGLNRALGTALRQERQALPPAATLSQGLEERRDALAQARLRQFQLQQDNTLSSDDEVAELLGADQVDAETMAQLARLVRDRRALRDQLNLNYSRYTEQLLALNRDQQQLMAQLAGYAELLDEKLFWIASGPPIDSHWLGRLGRGLAWLTAADHWEAVGAALARDARAHPLRLAAAIALLLALLSARPLLRRRLQARSLAIGTDADRLAGTVWALFHSLLLALPPPLALWLLGRMLARADGFPGAAGVVLLELTGFVFTVTLARQLCRPRGVIAHFGWIPGRRRRARHYLLGLLVLGLPAGFIIGLTEHQADPALADGLGRAAFILAGLGMAALLGGALGRRYGLWSQDRRQPQILAVAVPLLLAGVAAYGYYYTALQLERRLYGSVWLLLGVATLGGLLARASRLTRRRLARRGEVLLEGLPHDGSRRHAGDLDLHTADDQVRTLLRVTLGLVLAVGLGALWADLLPALNILGEVALWQYSAGEQVLNVTLGDVLLALVTLAVAFIAAANLPGLLEILLLSRLSMDPGSRYAITSLCRYLAVGAGLVAALRLLGVEWGRAQWLVAALGVGLGFGLQEIFANFVSGLILLFERPIRVGDTVTVADLSGQVTRIRIRATTIIDFDRREIIIPNKTFITDRLINWTLSDQVTRLVLRVDVAHGSDPAQVRNVLLDAARAHPRVLREPPPFAYLVALALPAQQFELHAFVPRLGDRLPTLHDLNGAAVERLTAAGIALAQGPAPPPRPSPPRP